MSLKFILPLVICITSFAQKDIKFNASSLADGMIDGGFEVIKKDVGYEFNIKGSNKPTQITDKNQIKTSYASTKMGFGTRLNFYKKLDKGITGRYASLFATYLASEVKTKVPEGKTSLCAGVSCGKKWLMYNRLGLQGDVGLGYDFLHTPTVSQPLGFLPSSLNNSNQTDISFLQKIRIPLRVAVIVRI